MTCALPQSAEFCIVCIGRDTLQLPQNVPAANQTLNTVYNIVIHAPDIVAYRLKVQVRASTTYHSMAGPLEQPGAFPSLGRMPSGAAVSLRNGSQMQTAIPYNCCVTLWSYGKRPGVIC